ncbi:MAG: DUF4142 domain-containing protein [Sphingomonas bacterium]
MRTYFLGLIGITAALSACNRSSEDAERTQEAYGPGNQAALSTVDNSMPPMADNMAMAASPDQGFANTAAASDNFEITTSKLAATNASAKAIKDFAREMIEAHGKSTAELKRIAAKLPAPITPDATLSPEQQRIVDDLRGKKGADFDRAYASAQVDAHQKTLDALQNYAATDKDGAFHGFVSDIEPVVKKHLSMAKGLAQHAP